MTSLLTRRQFLACSACAALGQGPSVRVDVRGRDNRGVDLALDEMVRTAGLLRGAVSIGADPHAAVIDGAACTLTVTGATFHIAASDRARRDAIQAWRAAHPHPAPDAAVEWHPGLVRFGAEQLNARFERRFGARMTSAEWMGWMAVKAAFDAQLRRTPLAKARFDGHKGVALYFGSEGHLVQPLCIVDERGGLLGTTDQV